MAIVLQKLKVQVEQEQQQVSKLQVQIDELSKELQQNIDNFKKSQTSPINQEKELAYQTFIKKIDVLKQTGQALAYNKEIHDKLIENNYIPDPSCFKLYTTEEEKHINKGRMCSPFMRKDTPNKKSNFSNVLVRLILTCKTYIEEFKNNFLSEDFEYIENNPGLIIDFIKILEETKKYQYHVKLLSDININNKIPNYIANELKTIFKELYIKIDPLDMNELIIVFLYKINNVINVAEKQINISFQDIIYNNYNQWMVGYTGTADIELNSYGDEKYVFKDIIPDEREKEEVEKALTHGPEPHHNRFHGLKIEKNRDFKKELTDILKMLASGNERGLIDLTGLFINFNNYDIAQLINEYF